MSTYNYNNCLRNSLFLDCKNDCSEEGDSSTDEDTGVGLEDSEPTETEYADEESEEGEEDDDDEENNTKYNQFLRKRFVPQVQPRSRQNGKPVKTVKKKRNHNTMERVRREKVSMCYAVLRSAMGVEDISRNRSLEVAAGLIQQYTTKLKEVDEKIEDYENKIKSMMG